MNHDFLSIDAARALADRLHARRASDLGHLELSARVEVRERRTLRGLGSDRGDRPCWQIEQHAIIVLEGGRWGEHRLDCQVSDAARVWAHWQGYCEAHGLQAEPLH